MTTLFGTEAATQDVEIRHSHIFSGLGGGARGFNRGKARVGNMRARFRCIGGIDVDETAIKDFDRIAGVKGTVLDLFSLEQYVAFHGKKPPPGWQQAMPADIHRAFGNERPHIVFLSAPCKGFSGLLSEKTSKTEKYQALNALTLRGIWLMLEAYKDDLPEFILFENVPRIAVRGRKLLDQICGLLRSYNYAVAETTHDCGKLGGLAQSRKRFLLVARNTLKVKPFLYEPKQKKLRGVGEILEKLPLAGDPRGGPMHRVPALEWMTWVRLAMVEAGKDWRSLKRLKVRDGVLADYGIIPEFERRNGAFGVLGYDDHAGTIAGESLPSNGTFAVADPKPVEELRRTVLGVHRLDDTANLIGTRTGPTNGAFAVADPQPPIPDDRTGYGVLTPDQPAHCITAARAPGQGTLSIADPKIDGHPRSVQLGVRPWDKPAPTVTGNMFAGSGPFSVADPTFPGERFNSLFRVVRTDEASPAVAGPGGAANGLAVADPNPGYGDNTHHNILRCGRWEEHAGTVTSSGRPSSGAGVVADPRPNEAPYGGKYRVTRRDEPAGAVIGASTTGNGAYAVADCVYNWSDNAHQNKMKVVANDSPANCVTGSDRVGSGALCVQDVRLGFMGDGDRAQYKTQGHYGVLEWEDTSGGVTASGQHDNGRWSVADPRGGNSDPVSQLPGVKDRLVCCIIAEDGTWHRPFTTLELAALQSLFDPDEMSFMLNSLDPNADPRNGTFTLEGSADSMWREHIGNAVPSDAAEAMAGCFGKTLLMAWSGESFQLSNEPIWVQPFAIASSVDIPDYDKLFAQL